MGTSQGLGLHLLGCLTHKLWPFPWCRLGRILLADVPARRPNLNGSYVTAQLFLLPPEQLSAVPVNRNDWGYWQHVFTRYCCVASMLYHCTRAFSGIAKKTRQIGKSQYRHTVMCIKGCLQLKHHISYNIGTENRTGVRTEQVCPLLKGPATATSEASRRSVLYAYAEVEGRDGQRDG